MLFYNIGKSAFYQVPKHLKCF